MAEKEEEGRPTKLQKTKHDANGSVTLPSPLPSPWRQTKLSYCYDNYNVAWICALHIEMAAAQAMLDEIHQDLPQRSNDTNAYLLGRIGQHNVVIACLPIDQYGTNSAANVLTELLNTFPSVRTGLMVGIGGGVPGTNDIRLGDVVVGVRVMQSDLGKMNDNSQITRTSTARYPSPALRKAVAALRAQHELEPSQLRTILSRKMGRLDAYQRPTTPDRLFKACYDHISPLLSCDVCDEAYLVPRAARSSRHPSIHYGGIASGNQVMRNSNARDDIARQLDVICFEMEASGLMDILPCLPIRGVCDYADSHKNKDWQKYAAAVAAAYATELLYKLPVSNIPGVEDSSAPKYDSVTQRRAELRDMIHFDLMDSRRSNIETALSKTCDWLLDHENYRDWIDAAKWHEHRGFLWIKGKPGVGKSTIMKFAYRKQKDNDAEAVMSFFFNARGEYLEKSVLGLYRSLIHQVIEIYPSMEYVLDDSELDPVSPRSVENLIVLQDLFRSAISRLGSRPLTCFIDALDECDEQQVLDMVHNFEELAKICASNGTPFKICFASRHYPYIVIRWGIEIILENQPGHRRDMAKYIDERLRMSDSDLVNKLRTRLLEKAAGVFMWIVLVVGILNNEEGRGRLALRRRVDEMPSNLSKLFRSILTRDEDQKEHLLLALRWILCAARPLHPKEFYHAMWSGLSAKGLVDLRIPDTRRQYSSEMINRSIISQTKGLAEVTSSRKPTVQFIHESVRDFLVRERGLQEIWPDMSHDWEGPSHEELKRCCEVYLKQRSIQDQSRKSKSISNNGQTRHPFLGYATQHVLYHGNLAAAVVPQDEFIRSFALSTWLDMNNQCKWPGVHRYGTGTGLLYVLADRDHSRLIRTFLRVFGYSKIRRESPINRYKYSFFTALAHGNDDSIAVLLGLESRQQEGDDKLASLKGHNDLNRKAYRGFTPLSWAVQRGLLDIVRLLVPTHGGLSVRDDEGRTPLSRAVQTGHFKMAKFLIGSGSDVNLGDRHNESEIPVAPLSRAVGFHMISLLVLNGARTDIHDFEGCTLLIKASSIGDQALVAFLLKDCARINAANKRGETTLMMASQLKTRDTACLLLEKGADVRARDKYGETSLHKACWAGAKRKIINLLLENGAKVNARDNCGETPLHIACWNGVRRKIIRLLLENGAKVNAIDNCGETPLHTACWAEEGRKVVSLLLGHGADVNIVNNKGETPLEKACQIPCNEVTARLLLEGWEDERDPFRRGDTVLMEACRLPQSNKSIPFLLREGADANAQNGDGQTALMEASRMGRHTAVSQLLSHGVYVNARNHFGDTALMLTSDADIRVLLKSYGARSFKRKKE